MPQMVTVERCSTGSGGADAVWAARDPLSADRMRELLRD
jgi:hypothetical protein